jgi:hypothetical protein
VHQARHEFDPFVANHRAGQQSSLEEDLETVADAENRSAALRKPLHRRHDWRKARDRTGPQVVAVGKAAGQNHGIGTGDIGILVPDELGLLAENLTGGIPGVAVGVGTGENDDGEFHIHHRPVLRPAATG